MAEMQPKIYGKSTKSLSSFIHYNFKPTVISNTPVDTDQEKQIKHNYDIQIINSNLEQQLLDNSTIDVQATVFSASTQNIPRGIPGISDFIIASVVGPSWRRSD